MRVRDVMKTELVTAEIKTPILEAQKLMREKGIKRLPILKRGALVGLVTKHMLLEASPSPATSLSIYELNYLISKMTVSDIMVKDPLTVSPDLPVEEAIWLGREKGIGGFPVVEKGELVGIITESDMTQVIAEILGGRGEGRRITLEGLGNRLGDLKEIITILDDHGIPLLSMMTVPRKDKREWLLIMRVGSPKVEEAVEALKEKGFKIKDVS